IAAQRDAMLRARYGQQVEEPTETVGLIPHSNAQRQSPDEQRSTLKMERETQVIEAVRILGEVQITQGNIDNNHIYLRSIFDRFPADAKGGSNKASAAKKTLSVDWGGPELVQTDLDGEKKFFRARSWIAAFFRLNRVQPGDSVRIEEVGAYRYRLRLVR
ncbi:MAG: hypothetical protein Q8S53_03750, partial [Brevundimonas sp.]|uniref:hypothetical protein n=1 Tax=Brevundimonas sp. TaxID=1871086 RepID=UPI0027359BB6